MSNLLVETYSQCRRHWLDPWLEALGLLGQHRLRIDMPSSANPVQPTTPSSTILSRPKDNQIIEISITDFLFGGSILLSQLAIPLNTLLQLPISPFDIACLA